MSDCSLFFFKARFRIFIEMVYLRVFTFWFDRKSIIPGNLGFASSVCRLRERGRMSKSKSVYVRVS